MSVVLQFSDHTKQHCRNKRSMITPEAWTPVIIIHLYHLYIIYIYIFWQKRKDVTIDLLKPDLIMWSPTLMQSWTAIVNVIRLSELRNKTFLFSSLSRRALTLLQFGFSQLNHSWCKDFLKIGTLSTLWRWPMLIPCSSTQPISPRRTHAPLRLHTCVSGGYKV